MIFDKKQKFSIRKYSVGVASVMIGATLLGAPIVHADETEQPTETVSRESLGEGYDTPRESLGEGYDTPRESLGDGYDTPRESLGEEVPRESVGEDVPRESLGEEVPRESLGETPHESVEQPSEEKEIDKSEYETGIVKQGSYHRENNVSNSYTEPDHTDPQKVTVQGPTKRTSLNQIGAISNRYTEAVEKAKALGFVIKTTDKYIDDANKAYRESDNDRYDVEGIIANRTRDLENFKSNRIENRLNYDALKRQHDNYETDVTNANYTEHDAAIKAAPIKGRYESDVQGNIIAREYYNSSWLFSLTETRNATPTTEAPPTHQSDVVAVLRKGQDVVINTMPTTLTTQVNGETKQIARVETTYSLISAPDDKVAVWAKHSGIYGGNVKIGVDKKTNDPLQIKVTIKYYDANGQEIVNTVPNVYYVNDLKHSTHRHTQDYSHVPTGILAKIEANGQTKIQHLITQDWSTKDDVEQVAKGQKVTFYTVGAVENGTPSLGQEITGDTYNEVDEHGQIKGVYHFNREAGYEHVYYKRVDQSEAVDEKRSLTISDEDQLIHTPGSSITRQGNELESSNDNVNLEDGARYKYNGDSTSQYSWGGNGRTSFYGRALIASKSNSFTFNTTEQKVGEYLETTLQYGIVGRHEDTIHKPASVDFDPEEMLTGPVVNVTNWISQVITKQLTKTEETHQVSYTDEDGNFIAADHVQSYTRLQIYDRETNEASHYYINGLLSKEEQEALFANFNQTGELFFERNGERIEAQLENMPLTIQPYRYQRGRQVPDGDPITVHGLAFDEVAHPKVRGFTPDRYKKIRNPEKYAGMTWSTSEKLTGDALVKLPKLWLDDLGQPHNYESIHNDGGNQTYLTHVIYKKSNVVEQETTRFVTVQNNVETEIAETLEGVHEAPAFIQGEKYHYNGTTTKLGSVTTHYYDLVTGDKPTDAPSHGEVKSLTRYVTLVDNAEVEIAPMLEGVNPAPTLIEYAAMEYQYTGQTKLEDGITTHYYTMVVSENPTDAPSHGEEKPVTRFVTVQGENEVEVADAVEGTVPAPTFVQGEKYVYNKTTTVAEGITTHYYDLVIGEKPTEVPNTGVDKVVTRFVTLQDGNEVDVAETVEGTVPAPKFLQNEKYVYDTTNSENSIITHYYVLVQHEVPNEAPNKEHLVMPMTFWVAPENDPEKNKQNIYVFNVIPPEAGVHEAEPFLQNGKYHYTGESHWDGGTMDEEYIHFYELVVTDKPGDAPVEPELPEFHQEVPGDAPVEPELPEFHQEIPGDAPVEPELPEFHQEIPGDAPVEPELPEFHQEIPGDAPVEPELPEFHQEVPGDAPVEPELPEYHEEVPSDAPIEPELPEYHEEMPGDAPVEPELPEFHQEVPGDAPVEPELPEYHEEIPGDAPVEPELPEYHEEVPGDAPVEPELPEYHEEVPGDAPINDVEEFHFEIPKDAPVNEVPELVIDTPADEPVETPVVSTTENFVPVLPKTGENDSQWVSALGLVLLGMVGIQLKQKKKEDE